ncbi:hypothetical protein [Paraburkholderia hospita]|uniref:hypothetical protein n=1 Tax=Paraburkholderia hospita TaxID=169430 RepID=UPI003ED149BF
MTDRNDITEYQDEPADKQELSYQRRRATKMRAQALEVLDKVSRSFDQALDESDDDTDYDDVATPGEQTLHAKLALQTLTTVVEILNKPNNTNGDVEAAAKLLGQAESQINEAMP